jgi:peptidoglycan glycosyltransferase
MWAPVTGYINPVLNRRPASNGDEQELSGTAGSQFLSRIDQIITGQPPRGSNVLLTLDPAIQRAAYDALGDYRGRRRDRAEDRAHPRDGDEPELRHQRSPSTTPRPSTRRTTTWWRARRIRCGTARSASLNPPGSTFKLVVASAALASGSSRRLDVPEPVELHAAGTSRRSTTSTGHVRPRRHRHHRDRPAPELQHPDGAARGRARRRRDPRRGEKYGFGTAFDIPLTTDASVYPPAPSMTRRPASPASARERQATPLQMAMVAAGIANKGIVMNPRMVDRVVAPDLTVQQTFEDTSSVVR